MRSLCVESQHHHFLIELVPDRDEGYQAHYLGKPKDASQASVPEITGELWGPSESEALFWAYSRIGALYGPLIAIHEAKVVLDPEPATREPVASSKGAARLH